MHQQRTFPEPQAFSAEPRPPIEMHNVQSNQVASIGYDAETKTLAVTFKRGPGAHYHYANVERETFDAFMKAESHGKFHAQHIKHLPFVKYPADPA